tara:strand:+ start:3424 stop:5592 length:2169 start_codon:yes stop_codon:yes gene_type:complete
MKKVVINLFLIILLIFIIFISILMTKGVETNKFNKFISEQAYLKKNINLELNTIKFKIDPKEISLFLETQKPKITYNNIFIPVQNIKVYLDFLSLLKSDFNIKKINFTLEELDVVTLKKFSKIFKPSNFKALLNNRIKEGKLLSEIDIFLNEEGLLKDFIAKGEVKNLKIQLINGFNLEETDFSFFADKEDILIKNIFGEIQNIKILDGDIKFNLDNGVKINSNFRSEINIDQKFLDKGSIFSNYQKFFHLKNLKANLNNSIFIDLDNTYKLKDYKYTVSGKINESRLDLLDTIKNNFIREEIKNIYLSNLNIQTLFFPKNKKLIVDGKYSLDNKEFLSLNLENEFIKDLVKLKLNFDYRNSLFLDLINYQKAENSTANVFFNLEKKKKNTKIKEFTLREGENFFSIKDLFLKENDFSSLKEAIIKTTENDFSIKINKKISVKGNKFDATNLAKFLSNQSSENKFKKINRNVEIEFKNIKAPLSEKLTNFVLLGEIKRGKFIKITSKGDFGGNNFLDISMKKDKNSNKKYLEIYSDLTRPLLTEYSFFKGLSGGKLLFTSIISEDKTISKLKIENFKVINAPGVIKLLSLADLGGLADLAAGEGLSFDVLEIDMEKEKNFLKLNEILALGPSMSVLMEGYQNDSGLTSLRGTLVPAKTLNKVISKIPVIGDIIIPQEIGEGLFGISFKMKGPKGKIKTTINPIRTLTPRFIQKIIDKNKKTK